MAPRQKTLLKWWLILLGLLIVVWSFQDNAWIARGAFVPVVVYAIWNAGEIREMERKGPTPRDIILNSKAMLLWVTGALITETGIAIFFLVSGRDLGEYIGGFGALLFVILAPILPPVFASQVALFRSLGNEEP